MLSTNIVQTKKLEDVNFNKIRVERAGFFIYTIYNGNIYIMVGIDSKTHDLTDFAGTIKYKMDKNVVNGAIRELQEETLEIFEAITYKDIKNCITVYDNDNLIIFMPVLLNPDIVCYEFNEKYRKTIENKRCKMEPEVCGVTWLALEEFNYHIKNPGVMYSRVQNVLSRAGNFMHLL
jgi:hypothetical protein